MCQKSEKIVEPICFNDSLIIGCFQYQICTMESNEKPNLKKYLQKCSLNLLVSAYQIANWNATVCVKTSKFPWKSHQISH